MADGTGPADDADANSPAVEHLYAALDTDDPDEKQYHIRQALQHLGVNDTE